MANRSASFSGTSSGHDLAGVMTMSPGSTVSPFFLPRLRRTTATTPTVKSTRSPMMSAMARPGRPAFRTSFSSRRGKSSALSSHGRRGRVGGRAGAGASFTLSVAELPDRALDAEHVPAGLALDPLAFQVVIEFEPGLAPGAAHGDGHGPVPGGARRVVRVFYTAVVGPGKASREGERSRKAKAMAHG